MAAKWLFGSDTRLKNPRVRCRKALERDTEQRDRLDALQIGGLEVWV